MIEKFQAVENVVAEVKRNPALMAEACVWTGLYDIEVWRAGQLVAKQQSTNIITTQGKRYLLYVGLNGDDVTYSQQTAPWYVILAGNGPGGGAPTTAPTPAASMTYESKGFTEFRDYDEAARPNWTATIDGTNPTLTNNTSKATFTVGVATNNTGRIFGAGLVSRNDKNDSSAGDYMLSYSNFTTAIDVVDDDVVKVGITVSLS